MGAPTAARAGAVPTPVGPPTFAPAQDAAKQVAIMAQIQDTASLIGGAEMKNEIVSNVASVEAAGSHCRPSGKGRSGGGFESP